MGRSLLVERALLALLLVVLAPVECGAGPWWGGHRGTRGYGAAGLAGGGGGPNVRSPRITRLEPPKGHVSGGTTLTIRGRGFVRSADLRVRFADENAVDEVRGTWVSSVEVTCVTPARPKPATTQVTVSNGDGSWSAPPLVYVAGSGTALTFTYDDSPPGCQGCAAPGGFQAALSPWERARERWESDRDSGPDSGGTTVHISSANGGMRLNPEAVCTPSSYIGTTSGHRYWVPNGGPGLGGKVFDVDPTSPGNGPPVTGTFYPSKRLACMFTCPLIVTNASDSPSDPSNATNPNSTSGSYVDRSAYHASLRRAEEGFAVDASSFTGGNVSVSSFALTRGVASDAATVSAKTAARWIDYTRIACVSPPRPTPSSSTRTLGDGVVVAVDASRNCVVTVTNDGDVFDDYYANGGPIGGSRDANATVMPNAAAVPFRYVRDVPTVTSISSRHGVRPEALARLGLPPARGPFAGGTTVTVRGDGFLPGDNLRCRFADDVTGLPPFVADATWVDDHTVTCVTPRRSPRKTTRSPGDGADPYPGDGTDPRASLEVAYDANAMNDTIAPCFVANVSVSNDGVAFSDASDGAEFLYCDVYASARTTADPTSYPYVTDPSTLAGTPNAPFTDLQSALHAALRGARVDVADGRTNRASTVRRSRGLVPRSARWLDKDVVRLAPGVYRGEGNVLLALDAQLVDVVAGDVDDWPDVERGGDGRVGPNAAVDCREVSLSRGNKRAGGSLRLFASQRVQVGGTPTVKPDGTGAIAGDGAVAFRGVSLEGCFDDAGAGESFADEGASCPAMEGRVSGGCRGDAHYVAPELPGHASGGYATDPDVWETWEYEDEDARYSNEAAWYDYEA